MEKIKKKLKNLIRIMNKNNMMILRFKIEKKLDLKQVVIQEEEKFRKSSKTKKIKMNNYRIKVISKEK